ncbi:uncharacterized protein DS421_10g312240 [Arachis hypogaea]|nr:uncharacterized protein DS421_10g312240 [Arachis hypogaea]
MPPPCSAQHTPGLNSSGIVESLASPLLFGLCIPTSIVLCLAFESTVQCVFPRHRRCTMRCRSFWVSEEGYNYGHCIL